MARKKLTLIEYWRKQLTPKPEWLNKYPEDAGLGCSNELVDRTWWIEDQSLDEWVTALDYIDNRGGDKAALLNLLRAREKKIGPMVRVYLIDLLGRYRLVFWKEPDLSEEWRAALKALHPPRRKRIKTDRTTRKKVKRSADIFRAGVDARRAHLLDLLGSGPDVSGATRAALVNIFEHLQLRRSRGRPCTPAYNRTANDWALHHATRVIDELIKGGKPPAEAIAEVRQRCGLPDPGSDDANDEGGDLLSTFRYGHHGGTRRKAARR
jgi:hypothetical protein